MLESYIRERQERRRLLLMTHIVIGYPTLEASLAMVDAMVDAGVDVMELQIPFSEPLADGPVILDANQGALATKIRVDDCLAFAAKVSERHPIPFLFMSYCNILFTRGMSRFVAQAQAARVRGCIVPDLPHEEGSEYLTAMDAAKLDPIFIFSPRTTDARLRAIASHARGFVYCVARKGVTGKETQFTDELDQYLARCRAATKLPLAVGFGVRNRQDIAYLRGKADMAVIGSETLRAFVTGGVAAVHKLVGELVEECAV